MTISILHPLLQDTRIMQRPKTQQEWTEVMRQLTKVTTPWGTTAAEMAAGITPSNFLYPEGNVRRYGATGDGSTDDTQAIKDAITVYRNKVVTNGESKFTVSTSNPNMEHAAIVYFPVGVFKVTDTLWFGLDDDGGDDFEDMVKNVIGEKGSIIYAVMDNKPVFDMVGSYNVRMEDITIAADTSTVPSIGILLARSGDAAGTNPSAGAHSFRDIKIFGTFQVASVYNYGSEINTWLDCKFYNSYAGNYGSYYMTSRNSQMLITSANTTMDTTYQSSYGDKFINCEFRNDKEGVDEITDTFDAVGDVDPSTDQITLTSHSFTTGDPVTYSDGGGTAPTGMTDDTGYYITKIDANNVTLYSDRALSSIVNITADGVGVAHTLTRQRSAIVTIEATSYGPSFTRCYFDSLNSATTAQTINLIKFAPLNGSSQNRTQGAQWLGCVVESGSSAFLTVTGGCREAVIRDCSITTPTADGDYVADIVLADGGHFMFNEIQDRKKASGVEIITYSMSSTGTTIYTDSGSATWDPGNIADHTTIQSKDITVNGAALGDYAVASFSADIQDLTLTASVTAANTVTAVLANNTGGAVDLGSGTIRAKVFKQHITGS